MPASSCLVAMACVACGSLEPLFPHRGRNRDPCRQMPPIRRLEIHRRSQPFFRLLHLNPISNTMLQHPPRRRNAMFTFHTFTDSTQRAVCLFLAVLIVSSSLALGAVTSQVAFENTYAAYTAGK
jgi:hypothetical protein